jgi:natural product precursor
MKRLKKVELDENKIISRLSNGAMKHLIGGYNAFDKCVAGCGCGGSQSVCNNCA